MKLGVIEYLDAEEEEASYIALRPEEITPSQPASSARRVRCEIAALGAPFIREGAVVLTHGKSKCVQEVLIRAAKRKSFSVVVVAGGDSRPGAEIVQALQLHGIPCTLIMD